MEDSRNQKLTAQQTNPNEFDDSESDLCPSREIRVSEEEEEDDDDDDDGVLLNEEDFLCGREKRILQWLQALDMQVMGACRADERLKPFLKVSVSSGLADDGFLSRLTQHFEASEVGLLARCFCIPLVSLRVGKIDKRGTLFYPTNTRGNLNLTLLPTSALRISFVGDNGDIERLASLISQSQCADVTINKIPSDDSGRSFLIRISEDRVFYFWCSEKSKLLGNELLSKMKDILGKKPSISELTGISESRLSCFASNLRAFLLGSKVSCDRANSSNTSSACMNTTNEFSDITGSAYLSSGNSFHSGHSRKPTVKANSSHQSSLNPRYSFFKDGLSRGSSSSKFAGMEKSRQHGDGHFSAVNDLDIDLSSPEISESLKIPETIEGFPAFPLIPSSPLDLLGTLAAPPIGSSVPQVPSFSSAFISPYYCWCPPVASALEHSAAVVSFPTSAMEVTPRPSSSLVTIDKSTALLIPSNPLGLTSIPIEFPAVFPDTVVRMSLPSSQQITFTPLMCDPIVHIPVIDVCSSGQGYLVSASPAITTMPPLHPNSISPLLPKIDPIVEKGARDTLRLLIRNSVASSPQLMDKMPAIFTTTSESRSIFAMGSRGLYSGTLDVNSVASSVASFSLVSESKVLGSNAEASRGGGNNVAQKEGLTKFSGSHSEDASTFFADLRKPRME